MTTEWRQWWPDIMYLFSSCLFSCAKINFHGTRIYKKTREFQKNIYFCFIDYAKAFDFVAHDKLWKILKEMGDRKSVV